MKYLVMETHPAYAVVLDERGRFLKAANLHYQVGETVEDVVELRLPPARRRLRPAWGAVGALAAAACLCLGFFGYWQPNFVPYGTLRIQINPDVELSVSKTDRVLDLRGLNADGEALLEGHINLRIRIHKSFDSVKDLEKRFFIYPVVAVHNFEIFSCCMFKTAVDGISVSAVFFFYSLYDVRIFFLIALGDFLSPVFGSVVYNDDFHILAAGQDGIDRFFHISF